MSVWRIALVMAACLTSGAPGPVVAQPHAPLTRPTVVAQGATVFPHGRHARLFPTCRGCHADVTSNSSEALFPPRDSCIACHDGVSLRRVEWRPPGRPAPQGRLRFSHAGHFARTDSAGRTCVTCHALPSVPGSARGAERGYMDVGPARQATCAGCHAHEASSHYAADNRCETCHVPLARAVGLSVTDVARLPRPASHDAPTFAATHGRTLDGSTAQCATCHARESCARCHLNTNVASIARLAPDARVAEVVRDKAPAYPPPDSHRAVDFRERHGAAAMSSIATCANCHARSSCLACHTGSSGRTLIRQLPEPDGRRAARGVQLINVARVMLRAPVDTVSRPVRAHAPNITVEHAYLAAAGSQTCEGCHARRFCSACHAGEVKRAFHPSNFAASHASTAYGADRECASCHNTEVFCRDCHRATGLASRGGRSGAFHTAQGQWLLQHGRAARQDLQTCTTCHQQTTCMRCHSTTGWGVSPHGPDFDAERLGRKAMAMCARCHITDPRRRSTR